MKRVLISGLVMAFGAAMAASPVYGATIYTATLTGGAEIPPNPSAGTGMADLMLNGNTLDVAIVFSGLSTPDTASHVHCCEPVGTSAGIAIPFTGFPTLVTSGVYMNTFDLTDSGIYLPAFLTANGGTAAGAETALIAGLNSGMAYINIHTAAFPDGEISGYLTAVPEPSTLILGASMLAGILLLRRRESAGLARRAKRLRAA